MSDLTGGSTRAKQVAREQARRARMWLSPGMGVKRWLSAFTVCVFLGAMGFLHFTWTGPLHILATRWILWLDSLISPGVMPFWVAGVLLMVAAFSASLFSMMMLTRSLLRSTGTEPREVVDVVYSRRNLARGPRIVALGGGTGLSKLLTGLKDYSSNITAVVTVADDGGSSGRLRESLDMVAPGDLTDCYAALSESPVLARLLLHRFQRGEGLEGHTFGNLMLATLSEEQGGLKDAMQDIHEVLRVRGQVFPATPLPVELVARLSDGREVRGESELAGQTGSARIEQIWLSPSDPPALPAVLEAIAEAELIVLGPGSLFTSIVPALLVPDIAQALCGASAPIVYVASIMTEPGETTGMTLQDHVLALTRHLGRAPDQVLLNSLPLTPAVVARYRAEGAEPLDLRGAPRQLRGKVLTAPLAQPGTAWHDPEALAKALTEILGRRSNTSF